MSVVGVSLQSLVRSPSQLDEVPSHGFKNIGTANQMWDQRVGSLVVISAVQHLLYITETEMVYNAAPCWFYLLWLVWTLTAAVLWEDRQAGGTRWVMFKHLSVLTESKAAVTSSFWLHLSWRILKGRTVWLVLSWRTAEVVHWLHGGCSNSTSFHSSTHPDDHWAHSDCCFKDLTEILNTV